MDKELKKVLEDLIKVLDKNLNLDEGIEKALENHLHKPCKIKIERDKDGCCKTSVEGTSTAILITLAGLEKNILEQLKAPAGLWELIKAKVGVREAGENE